jgi:type VI secretion system protein ImpM
MVQGDAAGWFGKLAVLGDFASRRLAPDWVNACDEWLSACIEASRRDLGERWTEIYLAAPVWRFAWGPGIVDERWWFGVLMPSCDSVGRYFPLVVTQVRNLPPTDRIALDHLELCLKGIKRRGIEHTDRRRGA